MVGVTGVFAYHWNCDFPLSQAVQYYPTDHSDSRPGCCDVAAALALFRLNHENLDHRRRACDRAVERTSRGRQSLVWRYKDADNYYVARWNIPSVRVDRVMNGERQLLPPHEIPINLAADTWHTLTVEHRGEDMQVFVGKERIFVGKDDAYPAPGKVGLWIKADSMTYFDDLTAEILR